MDSFSLSSPTRTSIQLLLGALISHVTIVSIATRRAFPYLSQQYIEAHFNYSTSCSFRRFPIGSYHPVSLHAILLVSLTWFVGRHQLCIACTMSVTSSSKSSLLLTLLVWFHITFWPQALITYVYYLSASHYAAVDYLKHL